MTEKIFANRHMRKNTLTFKPMAYQSSKAKLEKKVHIPTTVEYLAKAIVQDMKIKHQK